MMVSKEPHALSEIPMCEAPIVPYPLIHPSAWKWDSRNFAQTQFSEVRQQSFEHHSFGGCAW
jgi:hypothetical protein